jgi:phosphomannomutase
MSIADRVAVGSQVEVGSTSKTVSEIVTVDGVKVIFEDESWLLIRPSGTEPKVRIYAECRIESEKEDMFKAAQALFA